MTLRSFVAPHCHIQSLDSASIPEAFVKREQQLGTGHITVTDHGSMAACRKVYDLGKKAGLAPILGLEGYFFDDTCPILKSFSITDAKEYIGSYYHVTLQFQDQHAYETGVRLLSKADDRAVVIFGERKPPFTWADLEELGQTNTVVGSGCLGGMVQDHIVKHGRFDVATAYYEKLRSTFKPGNFFVEVFPHRITHEWSSGVYITYKDGTVEKFANWKNLRIDNGGSEPEKMKAEELARSRKKKCGTLLAVMENRVWVIREPKAIEKVEERAEFVPNECSPLAPEGDLQWAANRGMLILAKKYGDPVIISDDAHFAQPEDKIVQDVKLSASSGTGWRFYGSYHRQSSDEAFAYFNQFLGTEQKEFEGWVDNSYAFADKFKDFKFVDRKELPTKFFPSDTLRHLHTLIQKHGRMDWSSPERIARLKSEVELLHRNGVIDFLPYFFNAESSVDFYENVLHKVPGPGRGSAAGMLTAYLLGITHVDPLKYDLSQDRFMTLDRIQSGKYPDIDQDFGDREALIDPENGWLKRTFGDHYAQISVGTTLKLRSSAQAVARHMCNGRVPSEITSLTKKFQNAPQGITDHNFVFGYYKNDDEDDEYVQGSIEYDAALREYIEKYPEHWSATQKCLGIVKSLGRHASAFVITNEPISNFIPLTRVSDVRVTQYDMRTVEAVGGIKMDYLTVNSLNDISDCIQLIRENHYTDKGERFSAVHIDPAGSYTLNGIKVPGLRVVGLGDELYDIWDLPEDKAVFEDICKGKTEGVFQFNTKGAKRWLKLFERSLGLGSISDLAAFTALDRPGPLDYKVEGKHNMMVEYANRSKGLPEVGSLPILNELFPETYGIIVFQEQLQKAFQEIGGTTGIQANSFREHIGKKKMELVYKDKTLFMPKAVEKLGEEVAEGLWKSMETFGQYGFNKSIDQDTVLIVDGKEKPIKDCVAGETIESIDENGNLINTEIVALHDHGELEAFEIELDDGTTVVCSINHKFLTSEGMKPLSEITERGLEILAYENNG